MGIITPYSAQVRLLQDVVGTSRREAAAATAAALPQSSKGGRLAREDEGGSFFGGVGGGGGGGVQEGRGSRANTRGGISLPEIASVDGYQGREKEVRE